MCWYIYRNVLTRWLSSKVINLHWCVNISLPLLSKNLKMFFVYCTILDKLPFWKLRNQVLNERLIHGNPLWSRICDSLSPTNNMHSSLSQNKGINLIIVIIHTIKDQIQIKIQLFEWRERHDVNRNEPPNK